MTSSPFLLNATLEYHISNYLKDDPELAKRIIDSLYVDDQSAGEQTDDKAFAIYLKLKDVMKIGGFNLRKWCTNSPNLRRQLQCEESKSNSPGDKDQTASREIMEEDLSYAKLSLRTESSNLTQTEQKVLGLNWNFTRDTFVFPGRDNPADIPSRGAKASQLQTSDTWFRGPSWFVCDEGEWPVSKPFSQPSDECNQELKLNRGCPSTTSLVNTQVNLTYLLDPKRVSRFHKLLRITAYVLRFINRIRGKSYTCSTGSPRTAEIKAAEIMWIKEAQRDMDTKQLEGQLGLFKDEDQVIRCKGRVGNAKLPYVTRFPALLPRHHWLTTLIVRYCHERVLHNGLKETLNEIGSIFWITKGRLADG